MKLNFKSRSWHTWTSVILALPILVIALTALAMAHKKALGIDEITVAAHWLPGYRGASSTAARNDPRASLHTASGATLVGTLDGLYRLKGEQLVAIPELADTQIRALAEAPWGRIAATRNGVWLERDGSWRRVVKGDAWSAASHRDGSIAVTLRDQGLLTSSDGEHWQPDAQITPALASLPNGDTERLTLARLARDLHTGAALFGKDAEWIWIDLTGLALTLLALTGVYMWWRVQRRKLTRRTTPTNHCMFM